MASADLVDVCLSFDASRNKAPSDHSRLMRAIERDDIDRLRHLLNDDEISYSHSQLGKCLHMAALWGRQECVKLLLDAGTLPNIHDVNGNTPLIVAARQGHTSIVGMMIDAKCNVNKSTHLARVTSLHLAAASGFMAILRRLLESGADTEVRTSSGRTPLMLACRSGHDRATEVLLAHGANVNRTDNDRATALHFAAEEDSVECVRHLVNAGAIVDLETKYGDSACGLAARKGNIEVVNELLDVEGPSSNPRRSGLSPLHWAAESGQLECVQLLIDRCPSTVNHPTKKRYSRGDMVVNQGTTPIMLACAGGYRTIVELLIVSRADVDAEDGEGMTPLLHACQGNHVGCVEALLSAGACVDGASNHGTQTLSPLLVAIENRATEVVRLLLCANCRTDLGGRLKFDGELISPADLVAELESDSSEISRIFALTQKQTGFDCDAVLKSSTDITNANVHSAATLSVLCRTRIRQQMGSKLFIHVPFLPIPSSLKSFLLMEDFFQL